ncbi:MAG: AbrB/MazE/SpoVT family DNA-binding domain-containing protein [Desulfurococcaceae archaeon]|jgi:AbrB family looped-hinge helix DNA binding protein|nr:AbrB/MazE/SpoVT family DNA-binding domain-containing protein [Desulfurococcaceae archaeon]
MSIEETVKVDSKGRITIPASIRDLFNIREGMYLLMIADRNSKEIKLVPLPIAAKLMRIRVLIEDRVGVLAELTNFLAGRNIDIVSTKCVVLKREELGECEMIVDISRSSVASTDSLISELKTLESVKEVEVTVLT